MCFQRNGSALVLAGTLVLAGAPPLFAQEPAIRAAADPALPEPGTSPLDIDFTDDPVLALGGETADAETFRRIIVAALRESPVEREARALEEAARARVAEARSGYLPTLDMGVSSYRTIDRRFSNDPQNLLERSRPTGRTDMTLQFATPLIDFGGIRANVRSAAARLRAAGFEREARSGEVAGDMVIAWTQVSGYQALVRLIEGFVAAQDGLAEAVETRIAQGVSAEGDRARVASLRAQGEVELAQARRQLAGAGARFEQLSGFPAPDRLLRPPLLDDTRITREYAVFAAETSPQVKGAAAIAEARDQEAKAADARKLPDVVGRIDGGRYGVFDPERNDYDVRATVSLNWRLLGGGVWERARAADAEADAAGAVADRIREEAIRDASIAWSDVQAVEQQVAALEAAYKAARQSRDIVVVRFGALRGSLFDVADAQNVYLNAASAYIRALTELDQARYILLLRTGRLLEVLEVGSKDGEEPL